MCPSSDEGGTTVSMPRGETEVVDSFEAGVDAAHAVRSVRLGRRGHEGPCPLSARPPGGPGRPDDGPEPLRGRRRRRRLVRRHMARARGLGRDVDPAVQRAAPRPQRRTGPGPQRRRRGGAGRHRRLHRRRLHPGAVVAERPHRAPRRRRDAPHVVVQGRTEGWPEDDRHDPWARTVWVLRPTWLFETCNVAYRRRDVELAGGFPGATRRRAVPTASWSVKTPSSAGASWSAARSSDSNPGPSSTPPLPGHLSGVAARPAGPRRVPGPGPSE